MAPRAIMPSMERKRGPERTPQSEAEEIARIRSVYSKRDRSHRRFPPLQDAYRRLGIERLDATHRLLARLLPMDHPRLLDVGCGGGGDLAYLRSAGWPADQLAGVDLIPARLDAARVACPDVDLRLSDGSHIPFADGSMDVATAVTVFSSILDLDLRRALFADSHRTGLQTAAEDQLYV